MFSNLNKTFFGYFDPETIYKKKMKNNISRGDLTDILVKKALTARGRNHFAAWWPKATMKATENRDYSAYLNLKSKSYQPKQVLR